MWFSYDFGTSTVAVKSLLWLGIPQISRSWPLSIAFFSCRHRKIDEKWFDLILYRSFWPHLPNHPGREISGWLHQFPGKLAVHLGVDVTQLTISKFLRNPPSSCVARHPTAFEQLEYCWPWNMVEPPIDTVLFGQLRLSAVEREHNNRS
jgi:hypothetical protein